MRRRRLSIVHADVVTGKELAARGGSFDRRALLQLTRRSPIRPRRSRAEESARKVSAAKADLPDWDLAKRVDMRGLIQERPARGKHPSVERGRQRLAAGAAADFAKRFLQARIDADRIATGGDQFVDVVLGAA